MRWADRGSNLLLEGSGRLHADRRRRSPPTASTPAALTLRTRVNGAVVQEDSSANLIFPFGLLVADLSRFMTLEPGDVILTGTPAGCEPGRARRRGRGRDRRRRHGLQPDRRGRRADRRLRRAAEDRARRRAPPRSASTGTGPASLSDAAEAALRSVSTATLSVQLAPPRDQQPVHRRACARRGPTCGCSATPTRCATCRCARTSATPTPSELNAQKRAIESIGPDEVLVIDARGEARRRHDRRHPRRPSARPRRDRHRHRRRPARHRRRRRASRSRPTTRPPTRPCSAGATSRSRRTCRSPAAARS